MSRTLKVTVMGCGHSSGVPSVGNHWGHCDPNEPRNRRTRPSIAVQSETTNIVVDTGPDFREQINRTDIKNVHGVIYTHAHGDHIHGLDDLRPFRIRHGKIIDIYSNRATIEELEERFAYMFTQKQEIYPQILKSTIIEKDAFGTPLMIGDIPVVPFEQIHGHMFTLGLRFGDFAYSTDVVDLDQAALATLAGIRTWVVDCAGYKMDQNLVHFKLKQVFEMNRIVQAEQVVLTHMPGFMDYRALEKELPEGYAPGYDGMVIEARL